MYRFFIILLICLCLQGCGSKHQEPVSADTTSVEAVSKVTHSPTHFFGDYVDIDTSDAVTYTKSYLVMDCCDDWEDVVTYVKSLPNTSGVEGYEFYCYNESENVIPANCTLTFKPTEGFTGVMYEKIYAIHFETKTIFSTYINKDGKIMIKDTNGLDGIFLLIKEQANQTVDGLFISNLSEECNGQCCSCSDEW